jgi:prepilin-type N-terminal cleavage/methylation domain-containing protein
MRRAGWRIGFTLIELLVVIAIIAILAAILFPVFAQARDKARGSACLSNMKQIGTGVYMYLQDYDEAYPPNRIGMPVGKDCGKQSPPGYTWKEAIHPYVKNYDVWVCPSAKFASINPCCAGSTTIKTSYGTNGSLFDISPYVKKDGSIDWNGGAGVKRKRVLTLAEINQPAASIWVIEQDKNWAPCPDNGDWTIPTGGAPDRHSCGNTWVFCDGHAKWARLASTLAPWDAWNDKEGPNPYLKNLPQHNKVTGCQ